MVVFRAVLLIAVLVSRAACSGGTFSDPGHLGAADMGGGFDGSDFNDGGSGSGSGNSGGNGSGGGKPAKLADNASYDDAVAKVDEIIEYCGNNPGTLNDQVKYLANSIKITALKNLSEKSWSGAAMVTIESINKLIDRLQ